MEPESSYHTQSHVGIGLYNSSFVEQCALFEVSEDLILALPSTHLVTLSKLQSLSPSFLMIKMTMKQYTGNDLGT